MTLQVQSVSNSPTNAYPVGVFKTTGGTELQAVVLTDTSGNAINIASGLVPQNYDELVLSYTGADLTGVVYKLATVTVATLTLSYSGGNLVGVIRT